jgi:cation transport regulator
MPYATNDDLPPSVRGHLPPHAQDIFREAFNHAFARHDEATAFRIAWAAVKHRYEKTNGVWVERWPMT